MAARAQQLKGIEQAARAIGLKPHVLRASSEREIDQAFESIAQLRIPALLVAGDSFFSTQRDKIVTLAARHAVPAMYFSREFAAAGGLMSYGIVFADVYRTMASMSAASSRARSRLTCRSCSRPSSSS